MRRLVGAALGAGLVIGAAVGVPLGHSVSQGGGVLEAVSTVNGTHDAATRNDTDFNERFSHEFVDVDDVNMHYVVGGDGPPLVLIHGWPQTWYAWKEIMPELAEHRTVYAIDLPGFGDSSGTPEAFDKKTLSGYVHELLEVELDGEQADIVAHDLGAGVGFQYASRYPDDVRSYVHLDYPLPSSDVLPAETYRTFSWHMSFNSRPRIPEKLVDDRGDVREYLQEFYAQVAHDGAAFGGESTEAPFSDAEIDEYTRTYSRPEVLRAGFELYRSLDQDERDNDAADPVAAPTMLLTAEGSLAGTQPTLESLVTDLRKAEEVPDSGHWLAEESPEAVSAEIIDFIRSPVTHR
ncbi:alpha/beta hydrolase [Brevibacterium sp. S22]|nr:alpha/beta hydrolase [Brevibacterium sp. S22]